VLIIHSTPFLFNRGRAASYLTAPAQTCVELVQVSQCTVLSRVRDFNLCASLCANHNVGEIASEVFDALA